MQHLLDSNYTLMKHKNSYNRGRGWSGGAMVLDKLPVPGRPTGLD